MRKPRLLVAGIAAAGLIIGTPVAAMAMSGSNDPEPVRSTDQAPQADTPGRGGANEAPAPVPAPPAADTPGNGGAGPVPDAPGPAPAPPGAPAPDAPAPAPPGAPAPVPAPPGVNVPGGNR